MKNKISDLRDHMFAQLERLGAEDLTDEDLKKEISRATAIAEVGKVIVDSAKTEVIALKILNRRGEDTGEQEEVKKFLERPKAEYSNTSAMKIANT